MKTAKVFLLESFAIRCVWSKGDHKTYSWSPGVYNNYYESYTIGTSLLCYAAVLLKFTYYAQEQHSRQFLNQARAGRRPAGARLVS